MPTKKAQGHGAQKGPTLAGLFVPPSSSKDKTVNITQPIELQRAFASLCINNGMTPQAISITLSHPFEAFVILKGISPRESCIEAVQENLMKALVLAYGENSEKVYHNLVAKMRSPRDSRRASASDPSNDTVLGIEGNLLEEVPTAHSDEDGRGEDDGLYGEGDGLW